MLTSYKIQLEVSQDDHNFRLICDKCSLVLYLRAYAIPGPTINESIAMAIEAHSKCWEKK